MGAYAGQLETLLAIGGGDDIFDDLSKETQRFKPVVSNSKFKNHQGTRRQW
jgi:hypothetical protein